MSDDWFRLSEEIRKHLMMSHRWWRHDNKHLKQAIWFQISRCFTKRVRFDAFILKHHRE